MTSKQVAYQVFLRSPFWQDMSARKKAGVTRCEDCQRPGQELHCHHLIYRSSWLETRLEDLVVICDQCHKVRHGLIAAKKPSNRTPKKRGMSEVLKRKLKKNRKPKRRGKFLFHGDGRVFYKPE